jgi:hypothetical protein
MTPEQKLKIIEDKIYEQLHGKFEALKEIPFPEKLVEHAEKFEK